MLKKFALQDDGLFKIIPNPTVEGNADDAARQLQTDVLMTFDKKELQKMRRDIDDRIKENEVTENLALIKDMPLQKALWWFIENTSDTSPSRTTCFFALRERMRTET